jgi:nitroimidazol reductase NimA-like FMN-containing flavoprotein (pyridoxamine 5'-phosphate oxidase superfamily)
VVGRLGCTDGCRPYIVPISYHYDGDYIYCHTREGMKIDIMRKNPCVCFEVDHLTDMANWESVIARGDFEELKDPALRSMDLDKLYHRVLPLVSSETTHLSPDWPFAPAELDRIEGVTFRIRVNEKTGRFERTCATEQAF